MDPWGTPDRACESDELDLLTTTVCFLEVRFFIPALCFLVVRAYYAKRSCRILCVSLPLATYMSLTDHKGTQRGSLGA